MEEIDFSLKSLDQLIETGWKDKALFLSYKSIDGQRKISDYYPDWYSGYGPFTLIWINEKSTPLISWSCQKCHQSVSQSEDINNQEYRGELAKHMVTKHRELCK